MMNALKTFGYICLILLCGLVYYGLGFDGMGDIGLFIIVFLIGVVLLLGFAFFPGFFDRFTSFFERFKKE